MANILDSIKIKNSATVGDLLGIGTLNPGARLHVYNGSAGSYTLNTSHDDLVVENSVNTGIQLISPNTSYQYIAFGDPDSVNAGYIRYYHANNNMVFRTNGGDRMTINSSGNVGINDTNPSFKLTINSGGVSGGFKLYGSNSSYTGMFIGNTSTGAARIYMDASNGDFSGSDYSWMGQNNDLTFEIATSPNAGDILIKPNDTERVRAKTNGDIRLSNQQNGVSRLELYQNRQDVSNIGVWTIAAYNNVEVANLSFFRGSGGSSGYTKIFSKKNNSSSLQEVVQFGTNDALTSTFKGDIRVDANDTGNILTSGNLSATGTPQQFFLKHNYGSIDLGNLRGNINVTSGSVVISNNVTAASFIKSGGTSSQFLKANGSVDSNSYSTTSHSHNVWDLTYTRTGINVDSAGTDNTWDYIHGTSTTDGTFPGSYIYLVNFGDKTRGIQLAHSYGSSSNALYFRNGSDNVNSENGANVYSNWRRILTTSDADDFYDWESATNRNIYSGRNSGTTGAWQVNNSQITAYEEGLTIALFTNSIAGASTTTLQVNSLGAKTIYYNNDSKLTTHYGNETLIMLYFDATQDRWYAHDFYYSSADYEVRWQTDVQAGTYINGYQLLLQGADGKFYPVTEGGSTANTNTVSTEEFLVNGIMLYYDTGTDYAADAIISTNYLWASRQSGSMEYWNNRDSGWATPYMPIYLVGEINSNGHFVLDNSSYTSFLTQDLPTTDDGKVYWQIGFMSDNYDDFRLTSHHAMYIFKDGALKEYGGYAEFASNAGAISSNSISINDTAITIEGPSTSYTGGQITFRDDEATGYGVVGYIKSSNDNNSGKTGVVVNSDERTVLSIDGSTVLSAVSTGVTISGTLYGNGSGLTNVPVNFNDLQNKASGTGDYKTTGNFYAGRFYDSNGTKYSDPGGTSQMSVIHLGASAYSGVYGMEIDVPSVSGGINFTGVNGAYACRFQYGTTTVGSIRINTTSTTYSTTSDYRVKENFESMSGAIDRIKLLNPGTFNFIGYTNIVDGFIAHEVQEIIPEAVVGEKDAIDAEGNPEYQGIDQSKIVPLLTGALQEAIAKIEELETRIQTLENN